MNHYHENITMKTKHAVFSWELKISWKNNNCILLLFIVCMNPIN